MGFLIQCTAKCKQMQEPVLDKETDKVHCSLCGGVIENVSVFTKRQMRAMGQVKRQSTPKQAFTVECQNCKEKLCPELKATGPKNTKQKLFCPACGTEHTHLSAPYAQTIKSFLK